MKPGAGLSPEPRGPCSAIAPHSSVAFFTGEGQGAELVCSWDAPGQSQVH